nr:PREDICTED: enamelin [Rhinolophus sinicus]
MLLLQCRHGASFPKLENLVPSGKMKILLIFLGLLGNSIAMPMQMPRMPGFSSKSEEMMRYSQFNFMNSPHMAHLGPLYGNRVQLPQLFPQYQMPMWPQPPPNTGHPQKPSSPSAPKRQSKTDQTPETQKPNQPQPKKPPPKRPLKQPPPAPTQPEEEAQPPQAFPPFGNGLFPYQQPPWQVPHRIPPGYGRPPVSNEEGGNPYFGYFGYHGFGGRPPYYSEEMFEQDFEKPKEKDPPKTESPATEPSSNSTVPGTNSTQPNAPNTGGSQGGNDTSPTGNSGHGPNTASNPTTQNGAIPPPAVNVSGQGAQRGQIPWGPNQPNIYEYYPNPNIQSFPAGRQWRPTSTAMGHRQNGPFYRNQQVQRGPRWNSFAWEGKQAVRPGNPIYRKPYASTARGNSPSHAGNPANFRRKPQGPNKHPVGTSVAPLGPKHGTVGRNENVQNPREKPLGQKEKIVIPTRDPTGPWRNSQDYGVNKSNYKLPHPEGNMLVPNFNSIDQRENSYYPRGDSRRAPNSDGQTQNQNLPKGIILEPRRTPYESETNLPELKHSTYQPAYPEEIPSPAREHFPAGRNTWNHQEIVPPFKEDPGRQEELLPHHSQGSRGGLYYPDYNPYDPRENSPYLRRNKWDERDDSPNTRGQSENPLYPTNNPDPKETVPYNEEDPIDPTGDEPFPGQSRWGVEESSFKEGPTVRHYEGEHHTSYQPKEYLPYSLDNPSKPREDFPYGEFYPWNPDENLPVPTVPPPAENRGYYANSAVGPKESTLFPSWNSWDPRIQAQGQKERRPYFNRNFWDQPTHVHEAPDSPPHQKENQPYSSNSPAGLQKNPTLREGENLNYGMQITRLNSPEGEHLPFQDLIPPSYSSGPKEAHLFHLSQRGPCCAGGSTGRKDNLLALQDHTPSFGLAPGENQDTSPLYTKDSHTKHARHTISPTSTLPGQRNSSENRLPGESPNPSPFRDDVSTLRRNIPCSIKNQLDQRGIIAFSETSSLQSKNTPCLKSDLGGDGNNVLDEILEGSQLNERTVALTPEQLVIGTPDEGPKPEGLQREVQGNEGERQQERPSSILQLPCFGSKLAKYLSSSTGAPSSIGRQGPFNGDPMMPTEIPNSLAGLATGAQFQSINVDPLNADEHTPFDSLQIGTNPQDQVQNCLLLQA